VVLSVNWDAACLVTRHLVGSARDHASAPAQPVRNRPDQGTGENGLALMLGRIGKAQHHIAALACKPNAHKARPVGENIGAQLVRLDTERCLMRHSRLVPRHAARCKPPPTL